jgi:hypothetical protein
LAHFVLKEPRYAEYYRKAYATGREVILDNGIHELGEPLTIEEIDDARAKLGDVTWIIPPDWHGDFVRTRTAYDIAIDRWGLKVAPVVQGKSFDEMLTCYNYMIRYSSMVCFPYRTRGLRLQLIPHLERYRRHHFLGMNYLAEIHEVRKAPEPSLDTGKPFRYAQNNRFMLETAERDPEMMPKLDMNRECNRLVLSKNLSLMEAYSYGGAVPQPSS